jgi:hypothetical protein
VVAYLGDTEESLRLGIKEIATGRIDIPQTQLFRGTPAVEWVEVDPNLIRVERVRDFGAYWFGLQVLEKLGIDRFLAKIVGQGHEEISWNMMALTLVLIASVSAFQRVTHRRGTVRTECPEGLAGHSCRENK